MNYCTIEEAWGNQLNNEKKKKKKSKSKRLYNSQIPEYIEDSSYEDGGHDYHCDNRNNRQYHNHIKKPRKGRKIKSSRQANYEVSYGDAQKEYDNYKNETKRIKKNAKRNKEKKEEREEREDLMSPSMFSGYSEDEQLYNYNNESDMNIEMEDNQNNQNVDYNRIQYDQESGMENSDYLQTQDYNMKMIEGFESNGEDLDSHNIRDGNTKVKDVENNKVDNLMDKLLKEKTNNASSDEEVASNSENEKTNETTDSELTTTDEEKEVVVNTKKNANIKVSKKDIDYRLNNLNRSMNMIIKQMNKSQFFDDESQDNIHDLILFILFGIFIIFILDSIYKLGKNSSPSIGY